MAWSVERAPHVLSPLPHPLDSLIGREHELTTLHALLLRSDVRLLTLIGPGGVGKSRLAVAVATRASGDFDGVAFVALATIRDANLVLPTIAQALAPHEADTGNPADRLQAVLAERRILVVLDNVEQLPDAAPQIATLLAEHGGLTVLLTSRAVLRVSGERRFLVQPLALPQGAVRTRRDALAAPAVRLFAARAEAVDSAFAVSTENMAAVVEICRRLDGLPLALELAAARMRHLPPASLLARLEQRLPLLTGGPRDQPERLRTMRGAIAWSYDLLQGTEQTVFRRLAVFAGGISLKAAEGVGEDAASPAKRSASSVLDVVTSLVDQSLLRRAEQRSGSEEPRFELLETVREFAWEQLAACGEVEEARKRHAAFFLALAEIAQPALNGTEQGRWFAELEAEHDNLRAALRWALDSGQVETACRMAAALWRFWHGRHWTEGRGWLEQALASTGDIPIPARAEALLGAGALAAAQGDNERATISLVEAASLFRTLDDQRRLGDTLTNLGIAASDRGDHAAAGAFHEEALATFRREAVVAGIADTLHNLGNVAYDRGDVDRAIALWEESLGLEREMDRKQGIAISLFNLGLVARERNQDIHAAALARESLALHLDLGVKDGVAWCLELVAWLAAPVRADTAAKLLGLADFVVRDIGAHVPLDRRTTNSHVAADLRETLGEGGFAAAWTAGQRMTLDEALAAADGTVAALQTTSTRPLERQPRGAHGLTGREEEILCLLAAGQNNQEIAAALFISRATVARHVANIFSKFGVDSRVKATVYAQHHGLV